MRTSALAFLALAGCAAPSAVHPDTTLGKVVVYKSGVAYFERSATIDDDVLHLSVPAARLDDFLKSLTVVDERTGAPAPLAYTRAGDPATGLVDLEARLPGPRPHRLKLSYITEAPSWKATYRAVLGARPKAGDTPAPPGKVSLEGWAIVDNDSGEDWKQVAVGVGSSSALSFRFDLRSQRSVQREELSAEDRFAVAPPRGEAPYGAERGGDTGVLGELAGEASAPADGAPREASDVALVRIDAAKGMVDKHVAQARLQRDAVKVLCLQDKAAQLDNLVRLARERQKAAEASEEGVAAHDRAVIGVLRQRGEQLVAEANQCIGQEASFAGETRVTMQVDPALPPDEHENLAQWARRQRGERGEGEGPTKPPVNPIAPSNPSSPPPLSPPPPPRTAARPPGDIPSLAARIRSSSGNVLVEGYARPDEAEPAVAALRRATRTRDLLVAAGIAPERLKVVARGRAEGNMLVRVVRAPAGPGGDRAREGAAARALAEPIGASHFESPVPLTIGRGASGMISIVKADTEGEVVYLYDPESPRGNAAFPFRAVRLVNPTDSTLESGPVTVFGEGRFVGEGLCEPIPAHSAGFVPFALDRQVVADTRTAESDGAPRLVSVLGDALTTEVNRTRRTTVALFNRLREPVTVYVRHTVPPGYDLARAPEVRERVGGATLFKVSVAAAGRAEVEIEETSTLVSTTDIWSPEGLGAAVAYTSAAPAGPFRDQLGAVIRLVEEASLLQKKLGSARARLVEDREREGRLRAQVATLREARTSPALLAPLAHKLDDLGRQLSRTTLETFALDERLGVLRVRVTDAAHELRLSPERPASGAGPGARSR